MKVEIVPIDSLHEAPNSRKVPLELLLHATIPSTIGERPPILEARPVPILAKKDGTITNGLFRWKALKLVGATEVVVIYIGE